MVVLWCCCCGVYYYDDVCGSTPPQGFFVVVVVPRVDRRVIDTMRVVPIVTVPWVSSYRCRCRQYVVVVLQQHPYSYCCCSLAVSAVVERSGTGKLDRGTIAVAVQSTSMLLTDGCYWKRSAVASRWKSRCCCPTIRTVGLIDPCCRCSPNDDDRYSCCRCPSHVVHHYYCRLVPPPPFRTDSNTASLSLIHI